MTMRIFLSAGLAAAALAVAVPAQAQADLASDKSAGIVGERFDGYLGFVSEPGSAVRRQVGAINIRRRALYTNLSSRRRVTVQVAGIAAGCELLKRVRVGEAYMLSDGVWRRRAAGQSLPVPNYCAQ